jgi:hypothetical protein
MICATTLSSAKDGVDDRTDELAASAAAPAAPFRRSRRLLCIAISVS